MSRTSVNYRPEIDGLRAAAVAAVIANHFSDTLLPGGYLGVDVFFVISGYVISASLATEVDRPWGEFLLQFYVRRMKRLLPALVLCVLLTALVASAFIDPGTRDYGRMIQSGAWALLGASNIYFFYNAMDYFAFSTELNPFTHTWSLGVEEQFYLMFPAIFLAMTAAARKGSGQTYVVLFALVTAASLAAFVWLIEAAPSAAYFLMPMRFWELGLGYLAYLVCLHKPQHHRAVNGAGWLSAVFLATSFCLPVAEQAVATILAATSTAALIVFLSPSIGLYRALTLRPVIFIGLISYSLYLWHWSVLAISRWTIGVDIWTAPLQLALMFGLATLSYLYVERPLRYTTWSGSPQRTLGLGLTVCVAAFLSMLGMREWRGLYTGEAATMAQSGVETLSSDRWKNGKLLWPAQKCILSSNAEVGKLIDPFVCMLAGEKGDRKFLVIGNSFSAAEVELVDVLREEGQGAVILTSSWAASPVREMPNISPWAKANDYYWDVVVPQLIKELRSGDFLVMLNDLSSLLPAKPSPASVQDLQRLEDGLSRIVRDMHARGVSVIFQSATPRIRDARCTPTMATKQWFNLAEPKVCNYYSKSETLRRRQPLTEVLARVEKLNSNFHVLDLMPVLCTGKTCHMRGQDGEFLYRDIHGHPSVEANHLARSLLTGLLRQIDNARGIAAPVDVGTTR